MASFSFDAGNAGKLLRIPLYLAGWAATLVIPRTTRSAHPLWVFGSAVGVADGAEVLARTAVARGERVVWLAATPAEADAAAARGLESVATASVRGFWMTARAAVIVLTHGFGDVHRYAATGGVVVQLWHGIPLKRIGLDAAVTSAASLPIARAAAERLLRLLYRSTQSRIRVLPAASDLVRGRLESAFGLPTDRVPVTGEPRVDVLSQGTPESRRDAARARLAALVEGIDEDTPVVLYAPTWRDGAPDPALPSGTALDALDTLQRETGAVVLVRSHHLGVAAAGTAGADRHRLGSDLVADITPLLPGVDVLVTDYSSLAYDAALVPLPTLFFAPDLVEYESRRGFYGTYGDVAGPDPARDWSALVAQLRDVLTDTAAHADRLSRARALSARVHSFADGRSVERVYRAVRRLLPPIDRMS